MGFSLFKRLKGAKGDSGDAWKSTGNIRNLPPAKGMKGNTKKDDKTQQKSDKKRLKLILKPHNGSVLLALREAITQGIPLDVKLLLNSKQKQPLSQADWEGILQNIPAHVSKDVLVLLLDNCPPSFSHSDDMLWEILGKTVDHELWEQAASYSKRFSHTLLLLRVQSVIQSDREAELRLLLREFPDVIKLLDPVHELPNVPKELANAAFRTLLLKQHDDDLAAAIRDACKRNSVVDIEYLVTATSMNDDHSLNWIEAIRSALRVRKLEVLGTILDLAPADGKVRVYLLTEIRNSIYSSRIAAGIMFTKYIEKYSVIGLWNDIKLDEVWLLKFYLSIRPSYVKEVANTVDGEDVLHFLLSEWDDVDVLRAVFAAGYVDIEAPFKIRTAKTLSERGVPTTYEQVGKPGDTPLLRAVRMGLVDIADLLLSQGANINAMDSRGYTALHIVAETGDLNMARLIISKTTDFSALTFDGEIAADVAAANSMSTILEYLEESDVAPPREVECPSPQTESSPRETKPPTPNIELPSPKIESPPRKVEPPPRKTGHYSHNIGPPPRNMGPPPRKIDPSSQFAMLAPSIHERACNPRLNQDFTNTNPAETRTMYPDRIVLESRPRPRKYVIEPSEPAYWN
ncbi:hypothetical protein V494_08406 [Pseudogymnoascus sp. VKM F-4513 (FW-928)]|nr:hypothetical protein V494_08406 [Pseudogymnoascus sp. VKM F-4513 (FW-928)]